MEGAGWLFWGCRAAIHLAEALSRRQALRLAEWTAALAWWVYRLTPWRRLVQGHLETVWGPTRGRAACRAIARAHIVELARNVAELLRLRRFPAEPEVWLAGVDGWEHVVQAQQAGRPVLIVTAHYGHWELLAAALAHRGLRLNVLVQRPSQPAFDWLFRHLRDAVGVRTWENSSLLSLRPLLRALRRGEALGLLADQHGESQGATVELLGRAVAAPLGPVFLAQHSGAALLPARMVREADSRHRLRIEPPVCLREAPRDTMQAIYDRYASWIVEHPDHWLWVHNRWAREVAPLPNQQMARPASVLASASE
ncbi:MAG: lysophospholipid acyltransferase family protein [Candidatus Sericytochromatia bacterium]|nr:lysophospholipid acyltransferase family protein [Candidatus Sericytochromatia bacterium]